MPEWAVTLLFIAVAGGALLYAAWEWRAARRRRRRRENSSGDSGTTGTVYATGEGRVRDNDRDSSDEPGNDSGGSEDGGGGDGGGGGD